MFKKYAQVKEPLNTTSRYLNLNPFVQVTAAGGRARGSEQLPSREEERLLNQVNVLKEKRPCA